MRIIPIFFCSNRASIVKLIRVSNEEIRRHANQSKQTWPIISQTKATNTTNLNERSQYNQIKWTQSTPPNERIEKSTRMVRVEGNRRREHLKGKRQLLRPRHCFLVELKVVLEIELILQMPQRVDDMKAWYELIIHWWLRTPKHIDDKDNHLERVCRVQLSQFFLGQRRQLSWSNMIRWPGIVFFVGENRRHTYV